MENINNKTIIIEDIYGNEICDFTIDSKGNVIHFGYCEIADIENNNIRIQAIE